MPRFQSRNTRMQEGPDTCWASFRCCWRTRGANRWRTPPNSQRSETTQTASPKEQSKKRPREQLLNNEASFSSEASRKQELRPREKKQSAPESKGHVHAQDAGRGTEEINGCTSHSRHLPHCRHRVLRGNQKKKKKGGGGGGREEERGQ